MIFIHQKWLLWQQIVVKIANILLFFTCLKLFLNFIFQTWHSNSNYVKEEFTLKIKIFSRGFEEITKLNIFKDITKIPQ